MPPYLSDRLDVNRYTDEERLYDAAANISARSISIEPYTIFADYADIGSSYVESYDFEKVMAELREMQEKINKLTHEADEKDELEKLLSA